MPPRPLRPLRPPPRCLLVAALVALAQGCSSESSPPSDGGAGSGGDAGAAGAGQGGASGAAGGGQAGAAGGGQGGGQGGSGVNLGGQSGGGAPSFSECATGEAEAKPLPLDLYVMLDKSGSMIGPRWAAVTSALSDFVSLGAEGDISIGLQFFPLPGAKTCSFEAYAQPDVPIAPLPGNADPIKTRLGENSPSGETPTLPALQGAVEHAKTWSKAHPDHTVAVVLATDGEPNICGSTIDNARQVAKNSTTTDPKVPVFVVAVGQELTGLNAIAEAGGSQQAFFVDGSGGSTKEQFLAALNQIRGAALSCSLTIPTPSTGTLDPALVNVTLTPPGGQASVLPLVASAQGCAGGVVGWHYDTPQAPTQVVLCEAACAQLKAKVGGRVDLVFGCASVVK